METQPSLKPDIVGSVFSIPIRSESLDGVLCNEVLEHVNEPSDALKDIHRVLKPGGLLYITVPQCWGLHYEPNDYFRFTKYGIDYLLKKNGFKVEAMEQMGGLFSYLGVRVVAVIVERMFLPAFKAAGIHRGQYRISALAVLPLNLLVSMVALLDRFDTTDAYGWAVLARKES